MFWTVLNTYYPLVIAFSSLIATYKYIQIKHSQMIYLREEIKRSEADLKKAIQTRRELIKNDRLIANDYHLHELTMNHELS